MLNVSQSNALVYSALSAFFLVGMFAGWRVRSKTDFLSGIRSQSGAYVVAHIEYQEFTTLTPSSPLPWHSIPSGLELDRFELV